MSASFAAYTRSSLWMWRRRQHNRSHCSRHASGIIILNCCRFTGNQIEQNSWFSTRKKLHFTGRRTCGVYTQCTNLHFVFHKLSLVLKFGHLVSFNKFTHATLLSTVCNILQEIRAIAVTREYRENQAKKVKRENRYNMAAIQRIIKKSHVSFYVACHNGQVYPKHKIKNIKQYCLSNKSGSTTRVVWLFLQPRRWLWSNDLACTNWGIPLRRCTLYPHTGSELFRPRNRDFKRYDLTNRQTNRQTDAANTMPLSVWLNIMNEIKINKLIAA